MNNRRYFNRTLMSKVKQCSCGSQAKLRSRRNYTHGRNSNPTTTKFYRCVSCMKITF